MRRALRFFVYLLVLGVIGGIAAGGAALAVYHHYSRDLPDYQQLADYQPPVMSRVYAGDGRLVGEFVIEKAFVVCGKVPKPNVIYVLQASTINYEWETLKQDFLPKILNSVKKAPF